MDSSNTKYNENTSFITQKSKELFAKCLSSNTANPYFELSDKFKIQPEPSFCGLTNLVICLNAIKQEEGPAWKRRWKLWDEYKLEYLNHDVLLYNGMALTEFCVLLLHSKTDFKIYRPLSAGKTSRPFEDTTLYDDLKKLKVYSVKTNSEIKGIIPYSLADFDFYNAATLASTLYNNFYIVNNVQRKALDQEGGGHFMPTGAYDLESNYLLMIECARFKYNSMWMDIKKVYNSFNTEDPVTRKNRGFVCIMKEFEKKIYNVEINNYDNDAIKKVGELNLKRKALIINVLFTSHFEIKIDENKINIYKNWLKDLYNKDLRYKNFVDFVFMFDRDNFLYNVLGLLFSDALNN